MKRNTRCQCAEKQKITCPKCSQLKMVILLKNGNNHLKYKQITGNYVNPVWYNHLSKNRKGQNILVNAMRNRFEKSIYKGATNKLMFYDNQTKAHITTISAN